MILTEVIERLKTLTVKEYNLTNLSASIPATIENSPKAAGETRNISPT